MEHDERTAAEEKRASQIKAKLKQNIGIAKDRKISRISEQDNPWLDQKADDGQNTMGRAVPRKPLARVSPKITKQTFTPHSADEMILPPETGIRSHTPSRVIENVGPTKFNTSPVRVTVTPRATSYNTPPARVIVTPRPQTENIIPPKKTNKLDLVSDRDLINEPAIIKKESKKLEENTTQENVVSTQEKPAMLQETTATTQENVASTQTEAALIQDNVNMIQEAAATTQEKASTTNFEQALNEIKAKLAEIEKEQTADLKLAKKEFFSAFEAIKEEFRVGCAETKKEILGMIESTFQPSIGIQEKTISGHGGGLTRDSSQISSAKKQFPNMPNSFEIKVRKNDILGLLKSLGLETQKSLGSLTKSAVKPIFYVGYGFEVIGDSVFVSHRVKKKAVAGRSV